MKALFVLFPVMLSGCAWWTDPPATDVIAYATEPAYTRTQNGKVIATTCEAKRLAQDGAYSELPPGCKRDLVFASQVADPADLTKPTKPGLPAASTAARAANTYLYGGGGGEANGAARGTPGQVIVTPAAQAAEGQ